MEVEDRPQTIKNKLRGRFFWWLGAGHHGRRQEFIPEREAEVPPFQPDAGYWQSLLVEDDPDPEFRTYCHLFAARRPWRHGCLDELLRDIADDKVAGVFVTDAQMRRIHYPYDGGADVFLTTPEERDRTRDRHAHWLSGSPSGL
ncbi:hypothetical protein [Streptomyces sp. NPDC057966]|uniref:DUF3885 domain-containing protein n=1 Tax=Streptomyces sp. NPDC057966 TaxID=3346292 RepID=UPI0036E23AE9